MLLYEASKRLEGAEKVCFAFADINSDLIICLWGEYKGKFLFAFNSMVDLML